MAEEGRILQQSFDALDNIVVHPEGHETELEIKSVKHGPTKSGERTGITVVFSDTNEPNAEDIFWWCEFPATEMNFLKRLKYFYEAFDIPTDGEAIDIEDLTGRTGSAILGVEDGDDYGERNTIKRFVSGH